MTMSATLPLDAWICTGCGWLQRGHPGTPGEAPRGEHHKRIEGRASGVTCPSTWIPVLVIAKPTTDSTITIAARPAAEQVDVEIVKSRPWWLEPGVVGPFCDCVDRECEDSFRNTARCPAGAHADHEKGLVVILPGHPFEPAPGWRRVTRDGGWDVILPDRDER